MADNHRRGLTDLEWYTDGVSYSTKLASYRVSLWPDWKKGIKLTENSPDYDFDKVVRRYL